MTLRSLSAYGRAMRMRSCALRILLAATISMARVIFCVFCTLLILVRISLPMAIESVPGCRFQVARAQHEGFPCHLLLTMWRRSEEHTSELQSHLNLVCRLLLGNSCRIGLYFVRFGNYLFIVKFTSAFYRS